MSLLVSLIGFVVPGAGVALGVARLGAKVFAEDVEKEAAKIPPKVWLAVAIIAALVAGFFVHRHAERKALHAAYAQGAADRDAAWGKRLDQAHVDALAWKSKAEASAAAISKQGRDRNDQDVRAIGARADDQRLRGPGLAAAPAGAGPGAAPRLPAAAGGHESPGRIADAGLAPVPAGEPMAIVPWLDLVDRAAACDANRAEAIAWRDWHARQADLNRRQREAATSAAPPAPVLSPDKGKTK